MRGLLDITVGPWQMEDSTGTLDSDEEVEYTAVAADAEILV